MSKAKHSRGQAGATERQRGTVVPVQLLHKAKDEAGNEVALVQIDIAAAEAPAARFAADTFCVTEAQGEHRLIFGQARVDGRGLRALVDLRFPEAAFGNVVASFREFALGVGGEEPETVIESEPEQAVSMHVSAVRASAGLHGVAMDFFMFSPGVFEPGKIPSGMEIEPVVRVTMSLPLARGLVARLLKFREG